VKVLRAKRCHPCPRCGDEAEGRRVKARMAYECAGCGAKFWAPAVVVEVSGRTISERVRPLRRGSRLI
jgi:ribosomal protein L37AE/L43A